MARMLATWAHTCASGLITLVFSVMYTAAVPGAAPHATISPQIPSLANFTVSNSSGAFHFTPNTRIVVDDRHADSGSPSLMDYAQLFHSDLVAMSGLKLANVTTAPPSTTTTHGGQSQTEIFLTLGTASNMTYYNGKPSSEGYELEITSDRVVVRGVAPLGAWWATRTILQQVALQLASGVSASTSTAGLSLVSGNASDVPGWEVRGFMLDAGRHWFESSFLSDLCAYASFWKLNEFHLHASDNLWNPAFLYGPDPQWQSLYSSIRFEPSAGSPIAGLVPPEKRNETWSRSDFSAMQDACAARGVRLIPEIDTPGHSLVISQWKPELRILSEPDDLNLSHPDTVPTIKAIWDEFLPWFDAEEVSIGADEYDASLADDYINFVNEMEAYIRAESGKSIRVWGTNEPSPDGLSLSTNVTIQHWDFPGDSIPIQLMQRGYSVINSEQSFLYLDGKTSDQGQFPQELNQTLMWRGAPNGAGWAPNIFSATDEGNNTQAGEARLRGSIMALWNDWGNNATTQLEIYYQLARSLAVFGEKTWAGSGVRNTELTRAQFDAAYPILNAAAPGQNLNRVVKPVQGNVVFEHSEALSAPFNTGIPSVGPPYTLSFRVRLPPPSSADADAILFSGEDSTLYAQNLTFEALGQRYPLQYSLPSPSSSNQEQEVEVQVEIHATREYTYAVIDGDEENRMWWTTTMDIWGEYMAVGNMSFAAPSRIIHGSGIGGTMDSIKLTLGA